VDVRSKMGGALVTCARFTNYIFYTSALAEQRVVVATYIPAVSRLRRHAWLHTERGSNNDASPEHYCITDRKVKVVERIGIFRVWIASLKIWRRK
jgi:hypothetical protein